MYQLQRSNGFTLLELLVTLAISSILAAIAIPALSDWIDSSRSNAHRQQLQAFIASARSYALEQSQIVTICHLNDENRCSKDFDFPVSQFADTNRNAVYEASEDMLKILEIELPQNKFLHWNRNGYMRFWPSGGTGALTGSLSYCDIDDEEDEFRIVIARTGRVRIDVEKTRCE